MMVGYNYSHFPRAPAKILKLRKNSTYAISRSRFAGTCWFAGFFTIPSAASPRDQLRSGSQDLVSRISVRHIWLWFHHQKKVTGHPGSLSCCNLTNHLKPIPVCLENGEKEAFTIINWITSPAAGPWRKRLTFGWGSCIPVDGSSLSNTYIPNVWLLFLGGLPVNKERRIPFPWSKQWFGLVLYACSAAAQAASCWCWSYNWSCGKIFFKFDNVVGFDKMNH